MNSGFGNKIVAEAVFSLHFLILVLAFPKKLIVISSTNQTTILNFTLLNEQMEIWVKRNGNVWVKIGKHFIHRWQVDIFGMRIAKLYLSKQ